LQSLLLLLPFSHVTFALIALHAKCSNRGSFESTMILRLETI